MNLARPRRSALYLPASNARALNKARTVPCDVLIIDLEDAVAPEMKTCARDQAMAALREGGFGRREVVVRVNGLETPWGQEDLAAIASGPGPHAVLAPKVSTVSDVAAYSSALHGETSLWVMIETCRSIFELPRLAACASQSRLTAFVAGTNDLAKEMHCRPDTKRTGLLAALTLTVTAARAFGLYVLDGVFNDISDQEGLQEQAAQGLALGFDGKTLIHPSQVVTANRAFTPTADEVALARAIVSAFDEPAAAGKGVLRVDDRMMERLHLAQARTLIAVAEAIARADSEPG